MEQISTKQYMINYGLMTSVVLLTFSLMLFFLDAHYEQDTVVQITNSVITFAGITLGCLAYKKANDNNIQASTVRKMGTGMSLIIALVSIFYTLFLTRSYNQLIRNRKSHTKTKDPNNNNTHDNRGWGGG